MTERIKARMENHKYKDDWFLNDDPDSYLGGVTPSKTVSNKTIRDLDLDALEESLQDVQSIDGEIEKYKGIMQKLVEDSERYTKLSAKAFATVTEMRNEFSDKVDERRKSISSQESKMLSSMEEVESMHRDIARQADTALVRIKNVEDNSEKSKQAFETFEKKTKQTILGLDQKYKTTQSQLAGYTDTISELSRKSTEYVMEFDRKTRDLQSKVDEIDTNLDDWRESFEMGAQDFQTQMGSMTTVMEGLVDRIAESTKEVKGIKEEAQRQAREVRESITKAQKEMHKLDDMCADNEAETKREFSEVKKRMSDVQGEFDANALLLKQNQKDLENAINQLAQLYTEKKNLVRKCRENFLEAESVSRTFAEYKKNLVNDGLRELKSIARGYDTMYTTMTGSADSQYDILDDTKSPDRIMKQVEDTNEQFRKGQNPFHKKAQAQPQYQPEPQPQPQYQPQPEPEPVQQYQPQYQPEPQPQYQPQPQPEPVKQYQTQQTQYQQGYDNYQPSPYESPINSDSIADQYMAQMGQYQQQPEEDLATGMFFDEVHDNSFNQDGNFMETGALIGDEGTMILEGSDNLGEFDMPFSPAPQSQPVPEPKKGRLTGLFGRKKG